MNEQFNIWYEEQFNLWFEKDLSFLKHISLSDACKAAFIEGARVGISEKQEAITKEMLNVRTA